MEKQLMDKSRFNSQVRSWMRDTKSTSINVLNVKTHSTGKLANSITDISFPNEQDELYKLAFRFPRYGAFVHFGVGRGYVMVNGVVVRGYSAWSDKVLRAEYRQKGERDKDIRKMKMVTVTKSIVARKPVDFLNSKIDERINILADIAGEYFGDKAFSKVLNNFDKLKIKYGKK